MSLPLSGIGKRLGRGNRFNFAVRPDAKAPGFRGSIAIPFGRFAYRLDGNSRELLLSARTREEVPLNGELRG